MEPFWTNTSYLHFLAKLLPNTENKQINLEFIQMSIQEGMFALPQQEEKLIGAFYQLSTQETLESINLIMEVSQYNYSLAEKIIFNQFKAEDSNLVQQEEVSEKIKEFLMLMDGSWTDKGLFNYMKMRIMQVEDENIIMGFLNKCLTQKNYEEADRIISESEHYDPSDVKYLLMKVVPYNPQLLHKLCKLHEL